MKKELPRVAQPPHQPFIPGAGISALEMIRIIPYNIHQSGEPEKAACPAGDLRA